MKAIAASPPLLTTPAELKSSSASPSSTTWWCRDEQLCSCSPSASPWKWLRQCAIDAGEALQPSLSIGNTVAATFGGLQATRCRYELFSSAQPWNVHIFVMPLHHKDGPYIARKDENELVFPHQPPQQQRASLSRTGPKPKTHRAAAVAGSFFPLRRRLVVAVIHIYTQQKDKKASRKQEHQQERTQATFSPRKMLQKDLPFVSCRRKATTTDDDDDGRGRKREKDIKWLM